MNRIAGYSAYEKTPPDYNMALGYMERLFKGLKPESLTCQKTIHILLRFFKEKCRIIQNSLIILPN